MNLKNYSPFPRLSRPIATFRPVGSQQKSIELFEYRPACDRTVTVKAEGVGHG